MKTKQQKTDELNQAREIFDRSKVFILTDFGKVSAEGMRNLRRKIGEIGGKIVVIKKRLLDILLKEKGVDFDVKKHKSSVAAIFGEGVENTSGAVYKFFSNLGEDKNAKAESVKKILGGYDMDGKSGLTAERVIMIGQLPPREVLLAQVMGMLASPIRSLMYLIQEKAKSTNNESSTNVRIEEKEGIQTKTVALAEEQFPTNETEQKQESN